MMPITPTHEAVNKHTGEKILVEYNEKTGTYAENIMVCLIEESWDITPLANEPTRQTWSAVLHKEEIDEPSTFPCLHGCDYICPSYPMYRVERHVKPCPHAIEAIKQGEE